MIFPVVIGDSKRLFDGHACLELADLKTVGDDSVIVNVCRVYQMSIGNGEWKLWREGEPFNQRFTATISEDGNRIKGRWEYDDGDGWKTDFDLVYTRVR